MIKFPQPPPSEPIRLEDEYGDVLEVSSAGNGFLLLSVPHPDPAQPDSMIQFHRTKIIRLFSTLVDLSGLTPDQLWEEARERGMVNMSHDSRQQRRAAQRKLDRMRKKNNHK